jgi:hypothetical protein
VYTYQHDPVANAVSVSVSVSVCISVCIYVIYMHTHIYSLTPLARSLSRARSLTFIHTSQQHVDKFEMDKDSITEEEGLDTPGALGHRNFRTDYQSGDE